MSSAPIHRRDIDFALMAACTGAILYCHVANLAPAAVIGIPLVYVVLATAAARATLGSAAARGYLLCFFSSLSFLLLRAPALVSILASDSRNTTANANHSALLSEMLSHVLPMVLGPLVLGVAIYAICSVFEYQSDSTRSDLSLLQRFNEWIENSGGSEALKKYVLEVTQRIAQLDAQCGALTSSAATASGSLHGLETTARATDSTLSQVDQTLLNLTKRLKSLDAEISRTSASIDQLQAAVSQIGQVVDELSIILTNKILEL